MKTKTILLVIAILGANSATAAGLTLKPSQSLASVPSNAPASANSTTNSSAIAGATSSSQGGAAQGVGSQGQAMSIDSHAVYQAQERNPVATAVAPALMSSNDTCMGSTSVGASSLSIGLSVGSTWTDKNCLMLKNARELWNMGFKGAALARMCMDDQNREALEATGINCPAHRKDGAVPAEASNTTGKPDSVRSN